jgi:hypothetical protein
VLNNKGACNIVTLLQAGIALRYRSSLSEKEGDFSAIRPERERSRSYDGVTNFSFEMMFDRVESGR